MPVVQAGDDVIEFPDSMSSDDIRAALQKSYPKAAPQTPPVPDITLDPYQKARLSGMEPVSGPFGPANPQEVLALGQVPSIPAAAIEKSGIPQSIEEVEANFLNRTGLAPQAQPGVPLAPEFPRPDQPGAYGAVPPSELELAFPNVARGAQDVLRSFTTPGQSLLAPFAAFKPVQAAFEAQMLAGVPGSVEDLAKARTPEDVTKAVLNTGIGLLAGKELLRPAVKIGGEVVSGVPGESHGEILESQGKDPESIPHESENRGFTVIGKPDVKLSRKQAEKIANVEGTADAGGLDSQDLPKQVLPSAVTGEAKQGEAPVSAAVEGGVQAPPTPQAMPEGGTAQTVPQGGTVTPTVTQPELVGMGGAIPAEFNRTQSPTAMKYRLIDQERQQRGLEPLAKPEGTSDQATLDKAMAAIDRDPSLPDKLVAELNEKPRAIEDWENHVLMLHKIDLRHEYERSATEAAQAYDDSQQFPQRREDMQRANVRTAELSDKLEELERASRLSGSARGRALRSLQVMLNEDFSLAGLERQKRAAKGGAPLTDQERAQLVKVSKELQDAQKALAEHQSAEGERRVEAVRKAIEEEQKKRPYISPAILKVANKLIDSIDTRADAARERLKARAGRFSAGVDPTVLVDLAEIGMSHLAHAGLDFAQWSARMVSELGDWVKPHLEDVFKRAQKNIDAMDGSAAAKTAIKTGFTALKPEEQRASTVTSVKNAVAKNAKDSITFYVNRLARALVSQGVTEREKLIDAVHSVLNEAMPEITRREAMDAISGYGDFRQLSKDQITVKLREMKGEMLELSKLEDMALGKPPLKSGVERGEVSEARRKLIAQVNQAKRKFQVPVEDPATQLRSSLDTLKTTLENRIKDWEERLSKGDFEKRINRPIELDRKAQELQAKAEGVKRRFRSAMEQDRLAHRRWWERALDWATNYRRFGVLTSPTVIPKLISAGLQRLASLPLEDLVGSAAKVVPGVKEVAKQAPIEGGGVNLRAEMRGYGAAFTQGMRDAWNTLKSGHSDLDALYSKRDVTPAGEQSLGGRIFEFPGRLHGFLKAPVKRAVFERSVQRLGEFYAKQGLDVTDPLVKNRIGLEAYKAANAAIFLQDNAVASKLNQWLAPKIDKLTGHPTVGSKVFQTAGRIALPITRVPLNIVHEAFQYSAGLVSGNLRLAAALARGIDTLKPEQADLIMRELKKGSVGAAALMIGYANPNAFGGYYQRGEKRDPEDVKAGRIRMFGVDIPSWLLHNPLLETLQIGATIRRVADHIPSNQTEPEGLGYGTLAGALGVVEQVPFFREQEEVAKILGSYGQRRAALGNLARDIVVPQASQFVAKQMDMTDEGPLKRKTETIADYIKSGIPGARQTLEPK